MGWGGGGVAMMEGGEETDAPNPSLVAWLPFNTTGPIITSSPLAAHTHSSSSRELANTLHPHTHTCTSILVLDLSWAGDTQQEHGQRGRRGRSKIFLRKSFGRQKLWSSGPPGAAEFISLPPRVCLSVLLT